MSSRSRLLILAALLLSNCALPLRAECTREAAMMAERESSTLETWQDLHASYKKYKQCDDGAIGEGYSNSVGTLLSDGWNELPRLLSLSKADPGFGEFVLRHVDQTIPAATLQTISENARSRCPTDAASTCARIISAVQETLAPQ